jgi:hypothetical protein
MRQRKVARLTAYMMTALRYADVAFRRAHGRSLLASGNLEMHESSPALKGDESFVAKRFVKIEVHADREVIKFKDGASIRQFDSRIEISMSFFSNPLPFQRQWMVDNVLIVTKNCDESLSCVQYVAHELMDAELA